MLNTKFKKQNETLDLEESCVPIFQVVIRFCLQNMWIYGAWNFCYKNFNVGGKCKMSRRATF